MRMLLSSSFSRWAKFFIAAIFIFSATSLLESKGNWVRIKGFVDRNKITIGDKITYKVIIDYGVGTEIRLEQQPSELLLMNGFEIKDFHIKGPIKKGLPLFGKRYNRIEHTYLITTFLTGKYKIPELKVLYRTSSGEEREVRSQDIEVFVEPVKRKPGEVDDVRDIKKPVDISERGIVMYVLSFLPLCFALYLFFVEYKNRKVGISFFSEEAQQKPPEELAYERLEKLRAMDLISQNRIKEYYFILSEIVRRYLSARYGLPIVESTTSEAYKLLRPVEKKYCSYIKEFLEECDLVKFAKYIPEEAVIERSFDTAKEIIKLTTPQPQQQYEHEHRDKSQGE
jgi:hypothetical protein